MFMRKTILYHSSLSYRNAEYVAMYAVYMATNVADSDAVG
jgi:hypothetical protein